MKPEEAKDILSDMRDRHLVFLGDLEIKEEWQKEYLKEAWACDFGARALEKQIPKEPKYKKQLRDFFGVATVVKGDCPCCGKVEIYSNANYCPNCGQKLDWEGSEKLCQINLHQK